MKLNKRIFLLAVFFALLCLVSCYRGSFELSSVVAQPYVKASTGQLGLSVYFTGTVPSEEGLTMSVSSPDGSFSWTITANKASLDGVSYYGSSSLVMPSGALLPKGLWSFNLYCKDGRTLSSTFEVNYRDVEGALERSSSYSESFFDESSNLTVLL